MNTNKEKAKGSIEQLEGGLKSKVGQAINNEQMQAEGKATKKKGEARVEGAKAAERGKGQVENLKGNVKSAAGRAVGNEQMQAEGEAERAKGEARRKLNR